MSILDRYLLRQFVGSFILVLTVLTVVVWLTSSLRQLDLLVNQGQTLITFFGITLLTLPLLVNLIAPFALFIACLFVLNKLNTDSELIVISAAGVSSLRTLRPLLLLAVIVTIASWLLSLVMVPATLRELRSAVTSARADFIAQVIQPGRFTTVDNGLTLHVRDRGANGVLYGVFVNDTRDPDLDMTYLGARGALATSEEGTFLVLESGQVIRKQKQRGTATASVVSFDSYAFNMSAFAGAAPVTEFPASERTTSELAGLVERPPSDARFAGRVRSELHDRFAMPLYPLVFALIAFALLGRARTTRQSRAESVIVAIVLVVAVRVLGFFVSSLAQRLPEAVMLVYAVPLVAGTLAFLAITRHRPVTVPGATLVRGLVERVSARAQPARA